MIPLTSIICLAWFDKQYHKDPNHLCIIHKSFLFIKILSILFFDTFFDDTMMPYYNLKGNIHGKALGSL